MVSKRLLSVSVLALLLGACEAPSPTGSGATSAAPAQPRAAGSAPAPGSRAGDVKRFGAPLGDGGQRVALASLLRNPASFAGQDVQVEGEVRRACSRKGCWMELSTSQDKSAPGCRVTFKDYGFFVPTNSAGTHARLRGKVVLKTVSKGHVEHLESEGASFPMKNPDGTAKEVRLVATGVELSGWNDRAQGG